MKTIWGGGRSLHVNAVAATFLCCAGCAPVVPTAFDTKFPDNRPAHTAAVSAMLAARPTASPARSNLGASLIVAVTQGRPQRVLAFDVRQDRVLWRVRQRARGTPVILADLVLVPGSDWIVARELLSGRERWRVPSLGQSPVGAQADGDRVFIVSRKDTAGRRLGILRCLSARTGATLWRHDVPGALGRPAASSGLVFVPWNQQSLVVLEAATGKERARIRSTDDTISWVEATPAGVFYGTKVAYLWSDRSHGGTRDRSTYRSFDFGPLPARPRLRNGGSDAWDDAGPRAEHIALRFRFASQPEQPVGLAGGRAYFVFYRYVFALGDSGQLEWAAVLEHDAISSQATAAGLAVMDKQGGFLLLDHASGRILWRASAAVALVAATMDVAQGLPLRETPRAGGSGTGQPCETEPSLRAALTAIAFDRDNRLVLARAYAVEQLALLQIPEVTQDLLELFAQPTTPRFLREQIVETLGERSVGQHYLVEALRSHFDFLRGSRSPPLALIAPVLARRSVRNAVPALVRHLLDHETKLEDLEPLATAVVALGSPVVVPALAQFVRLYHADSSFQSTPQALIIAISGLLKHGGVEGRALVEALSRRRDALPAIVIAARERLAQPGTSELARESKRRDEPTRVAALSQAQIRAQFAPHVDAVRRCLRPEIARGPMLTEVRIAFVIDP
ncbi:MAG: PQQ-like beta-propeller repeat protein, partial [Proteobacteria bacterium]|nr:PQQ-like beta-propeller repeat protein [Pseudomonadota bacterium]